ncbi:MAG TPA: FAD-dependent oxidoreductase, partial [Lachnospiraceae bacterium]|nr:FAD-dependent oxidoreductase [Lachnospiraceae bacterium]
MIRISQIKLPIRHTKEDMLQAIAKALRLSPGRIRGYEIMKQSIDARKNEIKYIYTVGVTLADANGESESAAVKHSHNTNVTIADPVKYSFRPTGRNQLLHRPVVVGTGPAGLYCAWLLAK